MRKTLSLLILASVMMLTACTQWGSGVTNEAFDKAIQFCANAGGLNSLYGQDYSTERGWWKYQAVCNDSSVVNFTIRK